MHRKISYGGIGTALSVLLLALAVYMPTGRIALVFVSSLISYIMYFETDRKTTLTMYLATSALSAIMLFGASPVIVISYIICFGNYPILKVFFDKNTVVMQLIYKFITYSVYAFAVYIAVNILIDIQMPYNLMVLYFAGIAAFAAYDYLISYAGRYISCLLHK